MVSLFIPFFLKKIKVEKLSYDGADVCVRIVSAEFCPDCHSINGRRIPLNLFDKGLISLL
jgi:hypothetical protein